MVRTRKYDNPDSEIKCDKSKYGSAVSTDTQAGKEEVTIMGYFIFIYTRVSATKIVFPCPERPYWLGLVRVSVPEGHT